MDFILKKIVSFFIMPFPLGMLVILLGLFFLFRNKIFKAKLFLSIGFLWITLISYSPISNSLLYTHESRIATLHHAPEVKYIYILGSGHHTDENHPITSLLAPTSSIRFTEALRLYHQLDERPTLIFSGYGGFYNSESHAFMQGKLALALGVKKEHIHLEPKPRDTQEEAKVAKKLIGDKPFIVVTSASHMQRALKFFEQEGLSPIPAPTNHLATIATPNYLGFYSVESLDKMRRVWHEMLGQLWQKIKSF
jgi:uncharacterized SAM-binding protein YcdF (DUF218 family)